jgi:hypothetical protein
MWTDIKKKQPTHDGPYTVFGTVNKGTQHETNSKFTAYWCEQSKSFTDKDGEDLTVITESVKFWFDFEKVEEPEHDDSKSILEHLCPNQGKLHIVKNGECFAKILDDELDILHCDFPGESCVNIQTEEYSYISLSVENLHLLLDLIEESEDYYDN